MIIVAKKCSVVFRVIVGLLFGLVIFFHQYNPVREVEIEIMEHKLKLVAGPDEKKIFTRELARAKLTHEQSCPDPIYRVTLKTRKGTEYYLIDRDNKVYDMQGNLVLVSDKFTDVLRKMVTGLKSTLPYGEMLEWKEADKAFPRYAKALVRDLDSGLSFRVQRRAGKNHADVQPLTAKDSDIMKEIYEGKWSWRRKAIVVEISGRKIAASMNGMPHGAGAIYGNKFPGHFCIHFFACKTHSGRVNLAHQMMVWKAAGKFEEMTANLTPDETIEVFVTALDQREFNLASILVTAGDAKVKKEILDLIKPVQWAAILKVEEVPPSKAGVEEREIVLEMGMEGKVNKVIRRGVIKLRAIEGTACWKIDYQSLMELMKEREKNNMKV